MHFQGIRRVSAVVFALTMSVMPCLAQTAAERPLTNADVVKMVHAGIPESVIVREIEISETNFAATPDDLIHLKQQHVPDGVLGAIVDRQAGVRMPGGAAPLTYGIGRASSGHHPLPNFDATIHVDGKAPAKVQIRKNQIKVEKAGVPLFSVSWKEAAAK